MELIKKSFTLLAVVFLSACSSLPPPSVQELASQNYGPYPKNYQRIVEARLKLGLLDGDSAKFRFWGEPERGWADFVEGRKFAYDVCVSVNAKNVMGGYVGFRPYYVFLSSTNVIHVDEPLCSQGLCVNSKCEAWKEK